MTIQELQVPPIGTNCYLLLDNETGKGAVIDPGGDSTSICAAAQQMGMAPAAILLTHGHYDHTGAVLELRESWPNVPVYLHPLDAAQMKNPFSLIPNIGETLPYEEGDIVEIGALRLQVLYTPGHTKGSVTLALDDVLFTGDTLFRGSCGRTDLPSGDFGEILDSLKRLVCLEGDRQVLPGHEERSTLALERKSNYYVRQALAR